MFYNLPKVYFFSRSALPIETTSKMRIVLTFRLAWSRRRSFYSRSMSSSLTRPPGSGPPSETKFAAALTRRWRQRRGLTHELVDALGAQLRGGTIKPGDKLPPESEIM